MLGDHAAKTPGATARRGGSPAPSPKRDKPRKRAPRGANRAAVLRTVHERPGATSGELAAVSGVERNTLYGLLRRLVDEGVLQTRALPTGRTDYEIGDAPSDQGAAAAVDDDRAADEPADASAAPTT